PGIDAADMPVRHGAARGHGVQKIIAGKVIDELAATAQEAKVLDAFDRAADKGVAHTVVAVAAPPHPEEGALAPVSKEWRPVAFMRREGELFAAALISRSSHA